MSLTLYSYLREVPHSAQSTQRKSTSSQAERGAWAENAPLCYQIAAFLQHKPYQHLEAIASALAISESTLRRYLQLMNDFCHVESKPQPRTLVYRLTDRGERRYLQDPH